MEVAIVSSITAADSSITVADEGAVVIGRTVAFVAPDRTITVTAGVTGTTTVAAEEVAEQEVPTGNKILALT